MKKAIKKYYIYQIQKKSDDKIVYIGITSNLLNRWRNHIDKTGYFNKEEFYLTYLKTYVIKKYALLYEEKLQLKNNLETDKVKKANNAIIGRLKANLPKTCPHCGVISSGVGYYRRHGNYCKSITIMSSTYVKD